MSKIKDSQSDNDVHKQIDVIRNKLKEKKENDEKFTELLIEIINCNLEKGRIQAKSEYVEMSMGSFNLGNASKISQKTSAKVCGTCQQEGHNKLKCPHKKL